MRTTSGKDWLWEPTRQAIYHRDGDACFACSKRVRFIGRPNPTIPARVRALGLAVDHVVPDAGNHPSNLLTLCGPCNGSKNARPLAAWRPELVARAAAQTALPLDRAEGRRRAELVRPSRLANAKFRRSRVEAERRSAEREVAIADLMTG